MKRFVLFFFMVGFLNSCVTIKGVFDSQNVFFLAEIEKKALESDISNPEARPLSIVEAEVAIFKDLVARRGPIIPFPRPIPVPCAQEPAGCPFQLVFLKKILGLDRNNLVTNVVIKEAESGKIIPNEITIKRAWGGKDYYQLSIDFDEKDLTENILYDVEFIREDLSLIHI